MRRPTITARNPCGASSTQRPRPSRNRRLRISRAARSECKGSVTSWQTLSLPKRPRFGSGAGSVCVSPAFYLEQSMAKLLNIDANPKTVKGQAHGYMTAILYLAPFSLSDVNLCPTAEIAGCWKTCLNVQGRGGIPNGNWIHSAGRVAFSVPNNAIQRARLARTRLFNEDQPAFMDQLTHELAAFVKRAERKGLVPCVRLNGTSDILWERTGDRDDFTVFANFPSVQFYDYTKLP